MTRQGRDFGPDCATCEAQGHRGIKAINVVHTSYKRRESEALDTGDPELAAEMRRYWRTGALDGGPIPYHPFRGVGLPACTRPGCETPTDPESYIHEYRVLLPPDRLHHPFTTEEPT